MAERVDVCIVGSGFGGSILAYYLAQAGQRVVVLERGARHDLEDLQVPLDAKQLLGVTHSFVGLGAQILTGTGVGGGSVVYSGASLRAPSFVFERRDRKGRIWPAALTRGVLDRYYARAERGLGVHQLTFDEVARRGGSWALRMNRLGYRVDPIRQATTDCLHCGFCNTGCRFGRKNELTLNYLHGAEAAGAEVRPHREAIAVRPADGGYRVLYGKPDTSSLIKPKAPNLIGAREIQARRVVVAGGAIGSAGLLLRSRPFLRRLSGQTGANLSGNGDLALMAHLPKDESLPDGGVIEQHKGVAMDTVCFEFLERHGFSIITQHQLSIASVVNGAPGNGRWWGLEKKRAMRSYGDQLVGLAVIGVDGSPGRVLAAPVSSDEITLTPAFGVSGIDYPLDDETKRMQASAREIVGDLVHRMGGELLDLTLNNSPAHPDFVYTAHPLGTARMSDTPAVGVVDEWGEVHGHPGLYVVDGAAVPTALGVNPSLTIAALAERAAERLVQRVGGRYVAPPVANVLRAAA